MNEKKPVGARSPWWRRWWRILSGGIMVAGALFGILSVVGIFDKPEEKFTLAIYVEGQGTTNPSPGTYKHEEGHQIPITPMPDPGQEFDRWSGDYLGTSPTLSITMDADKSVTASFKAIPTTHVEKFTMTIAVVGKGKTSPFPGSHPYDEGQQVTITATPSSDYGFDHWSGDATDSSATITVTMDSNRSITAHFVMLRDEDLEGATVTGQVLYNDQPVVKFTKASPDFWVRNEDTGKEFPSDPLFDSLTGTYTIPNVPPGRYGIQVTIDAADPFDGRRVRPGDFYGWGRDIVVNEGESIVQCDLRVERVIHLTSPEDNMEELRNTYDPKPTHAATNLRHAWDPVAEATSYKVTIYRYQEQPPGRLGTFWESETSDTEVVPSLSKSENNQFYLLTLSAYNSNGLMVGQLLVTYTNGLVWVGYQFRTE